MANREKLNELASVLTEQELGEVIDFAEFLRAKRDTHAASALLAMTSLQEAGGPSLEEIRNQPSISSSEMLERIRARQASS